MRLGSFNDLWGPQYSAPRVISTQDSEHKSVAIWIGFIQFSDVFKTTKHMRWKADHISWFQNNFTFVAVQAPKKSPLSRVNDEYLSGPMAVQGVCTTRRLCGCSNIETRSFAEMYMLIG